MMFCSSMPVNIMKKANDKIHLEKVKMANQTIFKKSSNLSISTGKIERYARRVSMEEIEKNGYNLNISRYVSTSIDEVQIDLKEVNELENNK